MSWLQRVIHGTIDFVFGDVLLNVIRTKSRTFAAKIAQQPKTLIPLKLWKRAVHVPSERGMIRLKDQGSQRDVEYVVQEHVADRAGRHFDLRLVLHGKSVSWAVPMKGKREGVSRLPVPGEKWAAIRQPDHLVAYNRFQGRIPKGEKGAGTVRIWAAGNADIRKIEGGEVHFAIHEGPARGEYVLVSTRGTQGLLISKQSEAGILWTKPRYTKKDLEELDALRSGEYVAERKVDGASVELVVAKSNLRAFSHRVSRKTGSLVEHTERLRLVDDPGKQRGVPHGTRLRAEAWHPRGVNFLSGTLNSNVSRARQLQRSAGPVRLDVFDITHYGDEDVRHLPYRERRALYVNVVRRLDQKHIQPVRQVKTGFTRFYEQQVGLKGAPTDGIVVKAQEAAYDEVPWIKVKPWDSVDCEVVGLTAGTGKHSGRLGALSVSCPDREDPVQVGTGFTDWEREWIWDRREDVVGDTARVHFHVRGGETTATGPRFDSWHPDKSEVALKMYADVMDAEPYALKSAAGWRRAA